MSERDAETGPRSMQVRSVPAGKAASRVTARCAHGRGEVLASWAEVEDAEGRAAIMRRLVASVRAEAGCRCGEEILGELGEA